MRAFSIAATVAAVAAVATVVTVAAACTTASPDTAAWQSRLTGDTVALLGEVHDNSHLHRRRLDALARAFAAGWRPTIAMEQFDREHQADIERARRERPGDAQHVIDAASAHSGGGWNWDFYRPVIALALRYEVPLVAADLSNADTTKIVRDGDAAVFDPAAIVRLGLDRAVAADWEAAQEREIDAGHCHALPAALWPRMARAQLARDAVMAAAVRDHARGGVVLVAGNGHARRDLGVPRWLAGIEPSRVLSVGFLEDGDDDPIAAPAFDAIVRAPAAERDDPCAAFRAPPPSRAP